MRHILVLILASVACFLLFGSAPFGSQHIITPAVHAQEGCSIATLRGAYGFFRTGTTAVGPLGAVGTSTGRQTIRKNGITTVDLLTDPPLIPPYEVNPDCSERFLDTDGTAFGHAVVVDRGREPFIMSLSTGNTVT